MLLHTVAYKLTATSISSLGFSLILIFIFLASSFHLFLKILFYIAKVYVFLLAALNLLILCLLNNIIMVIWLSMGNFLEDDNVLVRGFKDFPLADGVLTAH